MNNQNQRAEGAADQAPGAPANQEQAVKANRAMEGAGEDAVDQVIDETQQDPENAHAADPQRKA